MRFYFSFIAIFLITGHANLKAQFETWERAEPKNQKMLDIKARGDFYEGEIKLATGELIKCELQYNFGNGIIYEKDGKRTRPYTANNVVYFKYHFNDKLRTFYALSYDIFKEGRNRFYFFEVLFEKSNLAVLSNYYIRFDGATEGLVTDPVTGMTHRQVHKDLTKNEKIYLVKGMQGIKPFLEVRKIQDFFGMSAADKIGRGKRVSYRIIDKSLLEEIFANDYDQVMTFIERDELDLKKIDNLIKAMDYYASIKSD